MGKEHFHNTLLLMKIFCCCIEQNIPFNNVNNYLTVSCYGIDDYEAIIELVNESSLTHLVRICEGFIEITLHVNGILPIDYEIVVM